MNPNPEKKITVEDLLRLKRSERPPAEFWARFESEMRAKQLAAIVVRRPWWDGASRIFSIVHRHSLSFGAVAALALAWTGVRYVGGNPDMVRPDPVRMVSPSIAAAPAPSLAAARPEASPRVAPAVAADTAPAPMPAPVAVSTVSHVTQAPETVPAEAPSREPFVDGITVTLAGLHEAAADLGRRDVFGSDREFEETSAPARQTDSEPLAQLDPSAERRARLLAPALPAYASSVSGALTRDWKRNSSSDDRMYESMDTAASSDRSVVGFRF
jgi:hypothetical protein